MLYRLTSLPVLSHAILCAIVGTSRYEVHSGQLSRRFVGDRLESTSMRIYRDGEYVAIIHDGHAYGWGNLCVSLSPCRRLGAGLDAFDAMTHDSVCHATIESAFSRAIAGVEHIRRVRSA